MARPGWSSITKRVLHGRTGFDQMETDASGRAVRMLSRIPPVPGKDLRLYLDLGLQEVAEKAFGSYLGGLVALDPKTGGVLAMVSKPGFDPNLFVDGIDPETWKALNESPDRPMVNRALRGLYPPGSTVKPFMGLAGLELGVRKPSDTIFDPGYFTLPNSSHQYRDWKHGGHGIVDLHKAIVQSCDIYFYQLAVDMGIDRMHDYLSNFGFGEKTGIDLEGESSGLLPSREWKERRWHKPWYPGETVIAGIGQGYQLVTPLQLATSGGHDRQRRQAHRAAAWSRRCAIRSPTSGSRNRSWWTARWRSSRTISRRCGQRMVDVMRPGGTAAACCCRRQLHHRGQDRHRAGGGHQAGRTL